MLSMKMRLYDSRKLTGDIYRFRFEPERRLYYTAGQFAEFSFPDITSDTRGAIRQFTLSGSPQEDLITITVRCRRPLSAFKRQLLAMRPGDIIYATESLGDFVLPLDSTIPLVWIAGGVGITPFLSMAGSLRDDSARRTIRLLHVVSNQQQALGSDLFSQAGIVRQVFVSRDDTTGWRKFLPEPTSDELVYIAGPDNMVETTHRLLMQQGTDNNRIVLDRFLGYS